MSSSRYPEELKIQAVNQVPQKKLPVADVAARLPDRRGRRSNEAAAKFRRHRPIQIAGVPDRHEPDLNKELNYPYLFELIDQLGYAGWVGCEYRPRSDTSKGLQWLRD
jgi:hypothetical protein